MAGQPILCGAQAFNYGPSAKLMVIARELAQQGLSLEFWGEGIARTYAQSNFAGNCLIADKEDLANVPQDRYRAVVTVMDPRLSAWGFFHGRPVYAVDSLYWFWDWPTDSPILQEVDDRLVDLKQQGSCADLLGYVESLPPHIQQYANHSMATLSFVQYFPGAEREASIGHNHRRQIVSPIVDLSQRRGVERDMVLVSFSGMSNPLVSRADAIIYLQLVERVIGPALQEIRPVAKPLVAVSPAVIEDAKRILPWEVHALSHDQFLTTLNRSLVVIAPAGITTLYECLIYETPMMVLPEQHIGHLHNFSRLSALFDDPADARDVFPESLASYRLPLPKRCGEECFVEALYESYHWLLAKSGDGRVGEIAQPLRDHLLRVVQPGMFQRYQEDQQRASRPLTHRWPDSGSEIFRNLAT